MGTALAAALNEAGYAVCALDLRASGESHGDIRKRADVERALDACVGVVHLAAVSRVIDGERNPITCPSLHGGRWEPHAQTPRCIRRSVFAISNGLNHKVSAN